MAVVVNYVLLLSYKSHWLFLGPRHLWKELALKDVKSVPDIQVLEVEAWEILDWNTNFPSGVNMT